MNIQQMDLKTKVGQLFTFSAFHPTLDEATRRLITELKAGGLFIPTGSLLDPEQVYQLTASMQNKALSDGCGIPLFIAADFVAGAGCKLKSGGAVHYPKNRAIGVTEDEHLAYESGRVTAEESLEMGVNFNYSPVTDINNNPLNPVIGTHSFGPDEQVVSLLGNAVIRGYQEHGMIATAKHFPGHGDTHIDSHEDLPVLTFDRERLESFELVPFQRAIAQGVDAIMVGHIAVPALDESLMPASLSYEMITNLLRKQMAFEGLIVTDGLSMKGITNKYSMEEACILSILAGSDILLATADHYELAESMFHAVVDAVETGRIPEARIDESVERILRVKHKYKLTADDFQVHAYDASRVNQPASEQISIDLAWKAATPLHGLAQGQLSSIQGDAWILIYDQKTEAFAAKMKQLAPSLELQRVETYEDVPSALVQRAKDQQVVISIAHNAPISTQYIEQLHKELDSFAQAVWVHFGSEYDVKSISVPCLLLYDHAPSLQAVAAQYLCEK